MKKRFSLVLSGLLFATVLAINFQKSENDSHFMRIDLQLLNLEANASCELPAIPPYLPATECKQIWCQSTYSYSGCGYGNGASCSTASSC